ncbi:DUF4136 domain-containing protein [Hymenobacter sp. DG25A]|uniref:DUF4136 domain-containing protein n=1 Tax=Hymenobacter sp. DG25A TaxID=1385663 RepID=UPI0006BD5364|nr:DUF4136 domain-containing protein [Hymenobacter sp. DG25A]ALD21568.1 hypothetical protein AM218_10565 [Hymenobacter sp. DG25A]
MKPSATLLVALGLSLTGCFTAYEAQIESDYSYKADFRHYRTFSFVSGDGLAADTSKLGQILRDAIRTRLRQQGYQQAERRPDLLVNFNVYEGDLRFRGFAQPTLTSWISWGQVETENTPFSQREAYQPLRLMLREGTLLITLIDNRTNRAIWNGYASGVTVPAGTQGVTVLRRSVRSIFDEYRVFTKGYINHEK